jgi:hypothetical protein
VSRQLAAEVTFRGSGRLIARYGAAYSPVPVISGRSSVVLIPGGAATTAGMAFTIRPAAATIAAWL